MKIREFLELFVGRNPESELKGITLPYAKELEVVGIANRGEFEELLQDRPTQPGTELDDDQPPSTLPSGVNPHPPVEVERPLPAGCKWDDTYVILDDVGVAGEDDEVANQLI